MNTFVIDVDNLTVNPADAQQEADGKAMFHNPEELAAMAAEWPMARLVAIWNNLPGVVPVNRFTDRQTAVRRIWNAVQAPTDSQAHSDGSVKGNRNRAAGSKRTRRRSSNKPAARPDSKKATVIELLRQPKGATLKEIMQATGWQAHSVRGFISGALVKKAQLKVTSSKRSDGERVYQVSRG
jgi:hypothetical protein